MIKNRNAIYPAQFNKLFYTDEFSTDLEAILLKISERDEKTILEILTNQLIFYQASRRIVKMSKLKPIKEPLDKLLDGIPNNMILLGDLQYEISTAIFHYRQRLGLSQEEFACKLGITQAMVSKWESGSYNCSLSSLCNIADQMEYSISLTFQPKIKESGFAASMPKRECGGGSLITISE